MSETIDLEVKQYHDISVSFTELAVLAGVDEGSIEDCSEKQKKDLLRAVKEHYYEYICLQTRKEHELLSVQANGDQEGDGSTLFYKGVCESPGSYAGNPEANPKEDTDEEETYSSDASVATHDHTSFFREGLEYQLHTDRQKAEAFREELDDIHMFSMIDDRDNPNNHRMRFRVYSEEEEEKVKEAIEGLFGDVNWYR